MSECSICKSELNAEQADFTFKAYGKYFCSDPRCLKAAKKEADAATDAAQPPEFKILKEQGWKIEPETNLAVKIIDQAEITLPLKTLSPKFVSVAGYPYEYGLKPALDVEIKNLFDALKALTTPEKKKTAPIKTTPKATAAPQSESGGLGNSLATIQDITLSPENIISLICPKASMNEAVLFLQACKLRNLNPFIPGEVFLIKMDENEPAVTVVGKYSFLKKADAHPDYQGYTAGIIVMDVDGEMVEREGTFYMPKGKNWKDGEVFETLVGGWARIKRKGREDYVEKVALQEAIKMKRDGTPNRGWRDQPATMVRKVAVVRGHREAFPAELGGLYDRSEIGEENISKVIESLER